MKKIRSLSFYQNSIKFITIEIHKNRWILSNHGEIPLSKGENDPERIQRTNEYNEVFKKNNLLKSHGYITVEAQHTYLNKKTITTSEKVNHKDIIELNYKNLLPLLFNKNCYAIDYSINYCKHTKTTDISFMAMDQNKIDYIYKSCVSLNTNPLILNPTYQYFADILQKLKNEEYDKENVVFVESSTDSVSLVLIQNNNPILKRSIKTSGDLILNINNYFYYLKNYLLVKNIFIFLNKVEEEVASLLIKCAMNHYDSSYRKVSDFLKELPWIGEIKNDIVVDFQDCFLAMGGMLLDESTKRKN